MEGFGLLVIIVLVMLTFAIFRNACDCAPMMFDDYSKNFEGFKNVPPPLPESLTKPTEPVGYTSVGDLPSAPVAGLGQVNSLPYQNPVAEKSSTASLNQLKQDMDGFAAFEMPNLDSKSDPAVKLPLTRFKGDYQRVKDELRTVTRTPGVQSQLTVDDMNDMAANLRFLQRTYRTYANNQMVPSSPNKLSYIGTSQEVTEGFADAAGSVESDTTTPITLPELKELSLRLQTEITRLQATGTTDPVLRSRVDIFTKIKEEVDGFVTKINNKSMSEKDIPIMKSDYNNFLKSVESTSESIAKLISITGNKSLGSLFASYDKGNVKDAEMINTLIEKYANDLIKGTSFNMTWNYTSEYDLEKQKMIAMQKYYEKLHPGTMEGSREGQLEASSIPSRGEFDETIRGFDRINKLTLLENIDTSTQNFIGGRPPSVVPTTIGSFDWKQKAEEITENIRKAGMKPADFGAVKQGAQVSENFSWRGHTKMMCNRLSTHIDPGLPEQMGCPPVSWEGWRI
jgi:hypothetical protein